MNREAELVVLPIVYLVVAERDVSYCKVEEISAVGSLKSRNGYIRLGIKLLCYSSRNTV